MRTCTMQLCIRYYSANVGCIYQLSVETDIASLCGLYILIFGSITYTTSAPAE